MGSVINERHEIGCPVPCTKVQFNVEASNIAFNACYRSGKAFAWFYFPSSKVKVEEEYELMDLGAVISATGGSLGLFLGLSCYGVAWDVILKLKKMLQ